MSGTSTVRQLVLLLLLLGYGKQDRSEATSTSGSSDSTQTKDASTSSSQNSNPYQWLSKTEHMKRLYLFRRVTDGGEFQYGDTFLEIRAETERPFNSNVILPVPTMLRKLSVKMLNETYFSIREPPDAVITRIEMPVLSVPRDFHIVAESFMHTTFRKHRRSKLKQMARNLERYLTDYSVCSVKYEWHDFGERYWPRWVRIGECFSRHQSCSISSVMSCRPDQTRISNVLRYVCPNVWRPDDCDWRPIEFKFVMSCVCARVETDFKTIAENYMRYGHA